MREILFKAKRKDNGKWIEGYLFKIWEKAYILWGTTNGVPNMVEVDPDTVCQYTGLTDKNGKNIFEGDIVKFTNHIDEIYHEEIGVCVFEQDESNFCLQRTEYNPENYPVPTTKHTIYLISNETYKNDVCYEVVGNKFDNPELLKEVE